MGSTNKVWFEYSGPLLRDDFLFAGSALSNDCTVLITTGFEVSNEIGISIAKDKTIGPTTVLTFLGLEINTV